MDTLEKITRTCLYEGYLLWPYRRSALKNAKRWTFGGVYPQTCAPTLAEPSRMRTQVLLEADEGTRVDVQVRFLHAVRRQVVRESPNGPEPVDSLTVDGLRYLSWQEATERIATVHRTVTATPGATHTSSIAVPRGADREQITDAAGDVACTLVRSWEALTGTVRTGTAQVADGVFRLTVQVDNTTRCPRWEEGARHARDEAAPYAFLSTHIVLRTGSGRFHSLIDPPGPLRDAAAACENQGAWPVLVSDEQPQDSHSGAPTVLCSPVTLYDFPAVAPESPGDLFDGTEIDKLLILSVLSLTEEEQAEARACDPRAREILDRCAALTPEQLGALHGTIRDPRPAEGA